MKTIIISLAALVLLATGCEKSLKSTRAFSLPPGNAANGQAAFVALKCVTCHTVDGVQLPKPTAPAAMPSRTRATILAISSSVATPALASA